jgi:hypothetical protein
VACPEPAPHPLAWPVSTGLAIAGWSRHNLAGDLSAYLTGTSLTVDGGI